MDLLPLAKGGPGGNGGGQPPISSGRAYYQGLSCLSADFSNTPGLTADSGSVTILIRNFSKVKFEIKRPMFSPARPGDDSARPGDDSPSRTPDTTNTGDSDYIGVMEGNGLVFQQAGDLIFSDGLGGGVTIKGVYIREDGIEEIEQFEGEDIHGRRPSNAS